MSGSSRVWGFCFVFCFVLFCFEKGAHHVAMADLELTEICLLLPLSIAAGINGMHHLTWSSFTRKQSSEELTSSEMLQPRHLQSLLG